MATAPRPQGGSTPHAGVDLPANDEQRIRQQIHAATLEPVLYAADGAISIANQHALITKTGTLAALTLAAPTAVDDDGKVIEITVVSASLAHTVTFPSGVLLDGTTGTKTVWTPTQFPGCSLRIRAYNAKWYVISKNLGVVS